jgi:hypothetical protein
MGAKMARAKWVSLLARAADPTEEDVARDVSGAIDTVFVKRHLPADVDFNPAKSKFEIEATRWKVILDDVATVLNKLYGHKVFECTEKFAADTVDKPLSETMSRITAKVFAAL